MCIHKNKYVKDKIEKYHNTTKKLHHINIFLMKRSDNIDNIYNKYGHLKCFMQNFWKRDILSESFVNYLAKQILEGLNYMYRIKIFHMNINEKNIFVDSRLIF